MKTEIKTTDLKLTKHIKATPEQVYDVWIDAKSPGGPWFGAAKTILNATVDGLFYVAGVHDGKLYPHYGRFVTLERGKTIEHTWMSESTKGLDTTVKLTFTAKDGGTQVELVHLGVPDDEQGRAHTEGWEFVLGCIADRFAR
jgi:uncharacterized protein YndB with AHSA1/START domain